MLAITPVTIFWACATLVFVVLAGWLILALLAKQNDRRISRPLVTMLKVAGLSGVVFLLASVPSYVARVVNPEILPFIMPYSAVLFAVSFIVFIQKLESKRSGWYQMAVSLGLAAILAGVFIGAITLLSAVIASSI
ncbi:MAG: hypothetical protein KBD92_00765 [Thiopseudomonas sp.]|jgi:hypothetical protein|uniref:hypothetical protein n=1 Tax=Denitrificimonas caeni TaxID=521720 RepID=UPI0003B4EEF5|nr:hypothetical protein [Denitrificimonas caeni]MBP7188350.1 hypothetical protein [Thiopseudomonas sp.]MBP9614088.1 hypothetical protein [Thiopseudomonas sp.]HHX05765.1 hypothetical protein [Pseudomonas sp.]